MQRPGKNPYFLTTCPDYPARGLTLYVRSCTERAAIARAVRLAKRRGESVDLWFRTVDPQSNEAYVGTASPTFGFSRDDLRA